MKRRFSKKNLWEAVPAGLKGPIGSMLGVRPSLPWLLGGTDRRWDAAVATADSSTREEVDRFQLEQLRQICKRWPTMRA